MYFLFLLLQPTIIHIFPEKIFDRVGWCSAYFQLFLVCILIAGSSLVEVLLYRYMYMYRICIYLIALSVVVIVNHNNVICMVRVAIRL